MYMDVIGPVTARKSNVKYIQCVIDSATKYLMAWKLRIHASHSIVKGLNQWLEDGGKMSVLMANNVVYLTSGKIKKWCKENLVRHLMIAPHRHEGIGLVERVQQTLTDRLRTFETFPP